MKLVKAILMLALALGVASVFAGAVSAADQTDSQLIVKGENADFRAANQTTGQNESGNVSKIDLNGAAKPEEMVSVENSTISEPSRVNTDCIVLQSTIYNCGPAALATVLNNLGINATEQELANLAGTDKSGTKMYGLAQAAQSKGLEAIGMELSVNELKKNDIVFLNASGNTHYSVILEVTNESVKLADPSRGNTEMSKKEFQEVYSGNALVTGSNISVKDLSNSTKLSDEEMKDIIGSANKKQNKSKIKKLPGKLGTLYTI